MAGVDGEIQVVARDMVGDTYCRTTGGQGKYALEALVGLSATA